MSEDRMPHFQCKRAHYSAVLHKFMGSLRAMGIR